MPVPNTDHIPLSLMTAKGDMIVCSDPGVAVRLPAGTDGQALIYDSTQRSGLKAGAAGSSPNSVAAIAEGTAKTAAAASTTHMTFDAQIVTGTDITAPDNKTFQINSNGVYNIVAYAIITPATTDAGMRQLRFVPNGSAAAEFMAVGGTATWTPDGVSNGTTKRIKLTLHMTTYMASGAQIQLDLENRDAANSTPVFDVYVAVSKLY